MNFKSFLFASLIILSTILQAQTEGSGGKSSSLTLGFQGGLNVSKFQTELDSTDVSARIGWQCGMTLRYGNTFFIQGNLELGQSSVELVTPDTALINVQSKVYRTFMSVPVMLGYKVFKSDDGSSSVRLMAGMEASAILNTKVDEDLVYIEKDDFEPYSVYAVGGIGMDLWFLRLDLGLHYGLTPMIQGDETSKNVMGTFNIGFTF